MSVTVLIEKLSAELNPELVTEMNAIHVAVWILPCVSVYTITAMEIVRHLNFNHKNIRKKIIECFSHDLVNTKAVLRS